MATNTVATRRKWFLLVYKQEPVESMCSSVVLVSTCCCSGLSISVSESESTAGGASTDARQQLSKLYKPVRILAGNNALTHYRESRGYDQISHVLSVIHSLY